MSDVSTGYAQVLEALNAAGGSLTLNELVEIMQWPTLSVSVFERALINMSGDGLLSYDPDAQIVQETDQGVAVAILYQVSENVQLDEEQNL